MVNIIEYIYKGKSESQIKLEKLKCIKTFKFLTLTIHVLVRM